MDQESFQAYAEQVGVDAEELIQQDIPLAIVIDQISYQNYASGKFIETSTFESEIGNRIELFTTQYSDMENEQPEREFVSSVQIGALTDQVPMGVQTASLGGLNLIVPEATMEQLALDPEVITTFVYLNSSDPMATQAAIEDRQETNIHVYNVYQQRQQEEQVIMLMSVFTYGFIALISLIQSPISLIRSQQAFH